LRLVFDAGTKDVIEQIGYTRCTDGEVDIGRFGMRDPNPDEVKECDLEREALRRLHPNVS
jgi:hypothetical protein